MTKSVYILLTQTGTVLSRIIKLCTKAKYNHVSLGLDKNLQELYSFARLQPRNPFIGGFVRENIKEGLFKLKLNTICCIYEIEVSSSSHKKATNTIRFFEDKKHLYKFNVLGLMGHIIKSPRKSKYERYCAEFVAEVLSCAEIHSFNKPYELVKPHDFHKIKNAQKIYEGKLSQYSSIIK